MIWPGDKLTGENGETFTVGAMVAYRGRKGCTNVTCTRIGDDCYGWHCSRCDAPCSSQGHFNCPRAGEAEEVSA
jgi:hypothetical protein